MNCHLKALPGRKFDVVGHFGEHQNPAVKQLGQFFDPEPLNLVNAAGHGMGRMEMSKCWAMVRSCLANATARGRLLVRSQHDERCIHF